MGGDEGAGRREVAGQPGRGTGDTECSDDPAVGPEHAHLHDAGRGTYTSATDQEALDAFHYLSRLEGIIPALESAHALVGAMEVGRELGPEALLLVNLSGRGDKDMHTAAAWFGLAPEGTQ